MPYVSEWKARPPEQRKRIESKSARKKSRHNPERRKGYLQQYRTQFRRDKGFVATDGEGVENDYVLLDSSIDDYPGLYTGQRLRTLEILEWLVGLANHKGCRGKELVLYGASYDFNNWMRDLSFENCVLFAKGAPVWYNKYIIQWQQGFKFTIGLTSHGVSATGSKNKVAVNRVVISVYDVLPFWQTSFVKALKKTFGSVPSLIEEGKEARGTFTHDNIVWVRSYNKLECSESVRMVDTLKSWFLRAGINVKNWNGPGAAAKAMLREHPVILHNGREYNDSEKSVYRAVGKYTHPDELTNAMLSAYAGGRNQILKVGRTNLVHEYDKRSAYPHAMVNLPCLTHGRWERTTKFNARRFGLWKIHYEAKEHPAAAIYPFFHRDSRDGSIHYPSRVSGRWAYTSEVESALKHDPQGVEILDGWIWIQDTEPYCTNYHPFDWISRVFARRSHYIDSGMDGPSLALKLAMNSLYGSIAQARGGTLSSPPWTQQLLWAGAITASIRSQLYEAAMLDPTAICHMATDGIISTRELPLKVGNRLGDWEYKQLEDVTFIQYGVYFAKDVAKNQRKTRSRGFYIKPGTEDKFLENVYAIWESTGVGSYLHTWYDVRYFVTCGLVAEGLEPYEDWCKWKERKEKAILTIDDAYCGLQGMPGTGLADVVEQFAEGFSYGDSEPYTPKWGKGFDFPWDTTADEYYKAYNASEAA